MFAPAQPHPRLPRPAFTLIEILITISIIVILASIGVAIGMQVKRGAAERATRTTMKALDGAMGAFLKDHPEPSDANWPAALQSFPPSATALTRLTQSGSGASLRILDGYGNPIHYIPSNSVPPAFSTSWTPKPTGMFWSYGRDGVPGSANVTGVGDDFFSDGASAQ